MIHFDGEAYHGEWRDDKAHGYGVYYYKDGSTYEGQWADDHQVFALDD